MNRKLTNSFTENNSMMSPIAIEPVQRECMAEVDASYVEQGRLSNSELTTAYIAGPTNQTTSGPIHCVWTLLGPVSYRVTANVCSKTK